MAAVDGTAPFDAPAARFLFRSPFLPPDPPPPPPSAETDAAAEPTTAPSALVILNSPVRNPPSPVFRRLWDVARYRVCADGGANRLYHATHADNADDGSGRRRYVPDAIRGDLDSLLPAVSSFYEREGTDVRQVSDQNSTDLDKALDAVLDWISSGGSGEEPGGTDVYVYGAFGGRFDHEMSALQALFKWGRSFGHRLFLYDDGNCAFLLPPDTDVEIRLRLPPPPSEAASEGAAGGVVVGEGPTCGLVPVGGRCDVVRTTGLEWDLDGGTPLEFGGLVSTSNRVVGEVVTVRTSHPLLFTAEVRCPVSSSTTGL